VYFNNLYKKIQKKEAVIAVVGLGYVGQPLISQFSSKDFNCLGIDIDKKKINNLKKKSLTSRHINKLKNIQKGKKIVYTSDFSKVKNADIIILCLPTPLKKNKSPDMSFILSSLKSLGPYLNKGQAISLESTTYPETTEEIIVPFLEKKKFDISKNFFVIYSPERESPIFNKKNNKYNLYNTPKICSGISKECVEIGILLYSKILKKVIKSNSTKSAEMAKMIENIYRAVNIGLVNELKMICHKMNINIHEVIELADTKPFGYTKFVPGPGLGGHCIPIDPFYLTWKAKQYNCDTKFIKLAGTINENVTTWTNNNILKILKKNKIDQNKCKILFLGAAYKGDIDDLRESPALKIMDFFSKKKISFDYCDPYIKKINFNNLKLKSVNLNYKSFSKYDCVVIVTDHTIFDNNKLLKNSKILIDTRGSLKNKNFKNLYTL
jgi:UDP-N-acetyl-D-glucosamine dehydrogenase